MRLKRVRRWAAVADDRSDSPHARASDPTDRAGGLVWCAARDAPAPLSLAIGISVPLIVRLEGNKVAEGKQLLAESGLNIIAADNLEDAAQKAVEAAGKVAS